MINNIPTTLTPTAPIAANTNPSARFEGTGQSWRLEPFHSGSSIPSSQFLVEPQVMFK